MKGFEPKDGRPPVERGRAPNDEPPDDERAPNDGRPPELLPAGRPPPVRGREPNADEAETSGTPGKSAGSGESLIGFLINFSINN